MVKANRRGYSEAGEAGEIPSDVVIDESTLHTLGYALRPMRKSELAWHTRSTADRFAVSQLMKLYQNAWIADPDNLELGVQVFQHAIRIQDWKTMQQVSKAPWAAVFA